MKKKVLLMGASGSGKTSMRSVIFSNNPASLTDRLGATIDVEQNHVRFLGDLILNLWDCGGQDSYMNSYLSTQSTTIFSHVGVLIYVFDVESRDVAKDIEYYHNCLSALGKNSPEAVVFVLIHKMDLVKHSRRILDKKKKDLFEKGESEGITIFGTSIHDESLYKAWSNIVHTLIPNAAILTKHLTTFADACNATEVILFERTTFLVIATSDRRSAKPLTNGFSVSEDASDDDPHQLQRTRYERTSELIKMFKYSCTRRRGDFRSLDMELEEFTAVLDELTKNTYVMVIVHDPTIETAAIKLNIRLARQKFEDLQADTIN